MGFGAKEISLDSFYFILEFTTKFANRTLKLFEKFFAQNFNRMWFVLGTTCDCLCPAYGNDAYKITHILCRPLSDLLAGRLHFRG